MKLRYRTPVSVFLNVTGRCNLSCVYCSANAGRSRGDLDSAEMGALVDQLVECRVCQVVITGGEPFSRRDTLDICARLRQARMAVRLNTNGTMLAPATCERLKALGIDRVSVSLDGLQEANDRTRGAGSFQRAVGGMKCLLAAGIRPTVLLTLNRHNLHALDETVHFCRRAGAGGVAVSMLSPMGRGADCYAEFSLDAAEWGEAVRTIRTLQAAYPGFIQAGFCRWSRYPTALEAVRSHGAAAAGAPRTFLPCDAAKTFCAITHDGWVIPCNKFPTYRCGNLRTEKLERIWQSGAMDRIRRLAEQPVAEAGTCAACKYNPVCSGGCRAEAYMAFQSLTAPDPACAVLRDAAVHTIAPQRAPLGARDLARHVPASENTH